MILYKSYGKNHATITERPWDTLKSQISKKESELTKAVIAFNAADLEKKNQLDIKQFTVAIQSLDWLPSEKAVIEDFFHLLDENSDGTLDVNEFLMVVRTMTLEEE